MVKYCPKFRTQLVSVKIKKKRRQASSFKDFDSNKLPTFLTKILVLQYYFEFDINDKSLYSKNDSEQWI